MSKNILLCGFYGASNLGDELMLDTLIEKINNIGEYNITIMVCTEEKVENDKYKSYNYILFPESVKEYKKIAETYDCLIFGGGAIIDDVDFNKNKVSLSNMFIYLSKEFIKSGKKTIFYGLSSNKEIINKEFIKKLNYIIKNCSYFSLRDRNSFNSFKSINIKNIDKVEIVDDIIISNIKLKSTKIKKNQL